MTLKALCSPLCPSDELALHRFHQVDSGVVFPQAMLEKGDLGPKQTSAQRDELLDFSWVR